MELEHVLKTIVGNSKNELANCFAISDEISSFTYKELVNFAKMIAANLQKDGVVFGDRVVIECKRSKEYVGALVGCWIMGAATIPLSDDYPEDRL